MDNFIEFYKRLFHDLGPIVFRNVVLLTNIIIYGVIVLLFIFHQTQAGFFLALAIFVAILIGIIQEVRARLALEKLQLLTALHFIRINSNGTEETVLTEQIQKNDRIKLKLGDQVPCDGTLLSARGLELNSALLTGESDSFSKSQGEKVQAGDIVTSGSGLMRVETPVAASRISVMTKNIKKYSANYSPIQRSISKVIEYSGYLLIVVIVFVVARGYIVDQGIVHIVKNVGALSSMLVPQGLVLATTILFAYGAVNLLRKQVLLQEINATEKLGRIKNLCVDKTGTLTENVLLVDDMFVPESITKKEAEELAAAYLRGTQDSSETIRAVKRFIGGEYLQTNIKSIPFSSARQYGAVLAKKGTEDAVVLIGAPDIFLPFFPAEEQAWLKKILLAHSLDAKRLLCVATKKGNILPQDLMNAKLSLVAVFVFYNQLRPGIQKVISFFQDRGVAIRVISGDNPATVQAVTVLAGIKNPFDVITGHEIDKWSEDDFDKKTSGYTIFARINPEQKEKIIAGFKKSGFTAMVGDGVNDALALKKADLGIAMFDGAPATRRLAAVVLMNNSFLALPDGVKMADNIIRNIEMLASLFFNQVALGFLIFIILSFAGYAFPFTPLNITLIDYFTIGLPSLIIFYWAINPTLELRLSSNKPFLRKVLPFAFSSAIIQAGAASIAFALSPGYLKIGESNTLVVIAYIFLASVFLLFTPAVYQGRTSRTQKIMLSVFALIEIVSLPAVLKIPLVTNFFEIKYLSQVSIMEIGVLAGSYVIVQYLLARRFSKLQKSA